MQSVSMFHTHVLLLGLIQQLLESTFSHVFTDLVSRGMVLGIILGGFE